LAFGFCILPSAFGAAQRRRLVLSGREDSQYS
jgi:hypothetical protein